MQSPSEEAEGRATVTMLGLRVPGEGIPLREAETCLLLRLLF